MKSGMTRKGMDGMGWIPARAKRYIQPLSTGVTLRLERDDPTIGPSP
jgi:hypothetical protein